MKKLTLLIILIIIITLKGIAQTILTQNFNGAFPPTGWSKEGDVQTQWTLGNGNNAGGLAPELRFYYNGKNISKDPLTARFVSPLIDLTGKQIINLRFRQMVDKNGSGYTIGVATRTGTTGIWNVVWSMPTSNIDPEIREIVINNANTGNPNFQFCFFITGNIVLVDEWCIDDISIFVPFLHDVSPVSINNSTFLSNTSPIIPSTTIKNTGLNNEINIPATLKITDFGNNEIYSNTQTIASLASGATTNVCFGSYTLPAPDCAYKIITYTTLNGDLYRNNDTLNKWVYTYTNNKQKVMVEIGTATWCSTCPGAAMGANELISNGHNVAIVENHSADSYAFPASEARNNYYIVTGLPTAIFDGKTRVVGGHNATSMYYVYFPIYNTQYSIKTAFGITISGTHIGNNYNMNMAIYKLAQTLANNLVLHVAVTQSNILENWQGQTHLEFVSRLMAPDENGTLLNFGSQTTLYIPVSFNLNPAWGGSISNHDFEVVAWIQDVETKEVYNAQKMDLNLIPIDIHEITSNNIFIYPNPASNFIKIKNVENASIKVFNVLGAMVLEKENISDEFILDVSNFAEGSYFIKILHNKQVFTKRISLIK